MQAIVRFIKDEEGATAIEYGLIAGLVAVGIIVALTTMGGQLSSLFTNISSKFSSIAVS